MDTNLWRKLRDNAEKYTCEAVGEIKQTHRFRGMFSAGPTLSSC
jgi:general transcription factor 3C polypeptide 5 (transcription factor C subunit 1)